MDKVKRGTLGKQHKIKAADLRFAARIVRNHVTRNKPAQTALMVKAHNDNLFELVRRLELAAAYEEQSDQPVTGCEIEIAAPGDAAD